MEQWQLATLSFKLWGALSPTANKELSTSPELSSSNDPKKNDDAPSEQEQQQAELPTIANKRSIGQAEIESAYFKVAIFGITDNGADF